MHLKVSVIRPFSASWSATFLASHPLLNCSKWFNATLRVLNYHMFVNFNLSRKNNKLYSMNESIHWRSWAVFGVQPPSSFSTVSSWAHVESSLCLMVSMLSATAWDDNQKVSSMKNHNEPVGSRWSASQVQELFWLGLGLRSLAASLQVSGWTFLLTLGYLLYLT